MTTKICLKIDSCKTIGTDTQISKELLEKHTNLLVNKIVAAKKYIVYESDVMGLFGNALKDLATGVYPEEALLHTRPQFSSMYVEFVSDAVSEGSDKITVIQQFAFLVESLSDDYAVFSIRPIVINDGVLIPFAEQLIVKTTKESKWDYVEQIGVALIEDDIFTKFPKMRDDINCTYNSALTLLRLLQSKSVGEYVHKPKKTFMNRKKCITKKPNEFRTLRIKVNKERRVIDSEGRKPSPLRMAQDGKNMIAGHFATYTREKPLFGTPGNFGEFWIKDYVKNKDFKKTITNVRVVSA